jgi:hypothetical protein
MLLTRLNKIIEIASISKGGIIETNNELRIINQHEINAGVCCVII